VDQLYPVPTARLAAKGGRWFFGFFEVSRDSGDSNGRAMPQRKAALLACHEQMPALLPRT